MKPQAGRGAPSSISGPAPSKSVFKASWFLKAAAAFSVSSAKRQLPLPMGPR